MIGQYVGEAIGEQVGGAVGSYVEDAVAEYLPEGTTDTLSEISDTVGDITDISSNIADNLIDTAEDTLLDLAKEQLQKKKGGSCGGGSGSGQYSASDGACHKNPKTPLYKLEIEENKLPENWWDKLPDFDPRVYDAIAMEQAAACVDYIFKGLPDMHEVENQIQANGFRKTCPRLKTQVPRTKVIKPKEVKQEVKIESFIKKDQTY